MPIPKPALDEKQSYITRIMSDEVMIKEYPDDEQRLAVAFSTWKESKKKKDRFDAERVVNVERTDICNIDISSVEKYITPEGFLTCPANFTRTGIFDYYDNNKKLVREYRPEYEVFDEESLNTLKLKPITYNHPREMVTIDNIKKYQVGTIGENLKKEDIFISGKINITDKAIIEQIKRKRDSGQGIELSCGYSCDLLYISGQNKKEGRYDAVQCNIKYNHVSIVDKGRAGREVKLKLDNDNGGKKDMALIKFLKQAFKTDNFSMDTISMEYPEEAKNVVDSLNLKLDEAITVIQSLNSKIAEANKKVDEYKAKADQLAEEITKAKADIAVLSDPNSTKVKEIIKIRSDIEAVAKSLKIATDNKDNKAIMVDVIKAQSPSFTTDGDGVSDDYIRARFDSIVEIIKANNDSKLGMFIKNAQDSNTGLKDLRADFMKKCDEEFNK